MDLGSWTHAHTAALTWAAIKVVHLVEKFIDAWAERGKHPVQVIVVPSGDVQSKLPDE